ncbi:MAG: hypothetical protein ACK5KN_16695 [Dysgonomonas sp.]|uniref:hypothetical protein n=1 Tax=Dysgonomonas sp. TaxID=1891233 RepID=UPI003A8A6328
MAVLTNSISQIPVEIFAAYIVEKLRRTNPHLAFAFDESRFVLGGAVVHIPQAGNSPDVVKNRNTFPATAVQRGDSMISYALDVFTTDPVHVTWHEGSEISYDKLDSVLGDIVGTLIETVGDNMLYNWIHGLKKTSTGYVDDILPAANIIPTTGAAVAVNPMDGQTGSRNAFSYKELNTAQAVFDKNNVPKDGRYAMLESYMKQQFIDSLSSNQMAAFQQTADLKNGIVGKFASFNILDRSSVLAFTAGGAPLVPGQALDADANLASFCWQKDSVAKAQGDIINFEKLKDPQYYGDVFSALVKFGGRCRREDWKGVLAIRQAS